MIDNDFFEEEFSIEDLKESYQMLLDDPGSLISSDEEFYEFLALSTSKEELVAFREVLAKNELYEWAAIVHKKILAIV